jgi:hypothetical protein
MEVCVVPLECTQSVANPQTYTSNVNLVKLGGKTIKEFKPSKSKPYVLEIQEPKCGKKFLQSYLMGA